MYPADVFAAFPIKERAPAQVQKVYQKYNEAAGAYIDLSLHKTETLPDEQTERKLDSGLTGSLAFAFGLLGIFPAAIILGIIGMQRHRKQRGFAIAGLVLGILTIFLIVGMFLLIIYMN